MFEAAGLLGTPLYFVEMNYRRVLQLNFSLRGHEI